MGWLIAKLFLRTAVFRKRTVLVAVFVGLELLLGINAAGRADFGTFFSELVTGFMLPVIALVFGSAVVRDDLEGGTLGYFLARPIPRSTLLVSRTLMASLIVLITGLVMTAGNAVALRAEDTLFARALVGVALGALAYTAVFVALGIVFRRTFLAGFAMLFLDWFLGRLPVAGRWLSVRAHVENLAGIEVPVAPMTRFLAPPPEAAASAVALVVITGVLLALATWRFRRFEFSGAEG